MASGRGLDQRLQTLLPVPDVLVEPGVAAGDRRGPGQHGDHRLVVRGERRVGGSLHRQAAHLLTKVIDQRRREVDGSLGDRTVLGLRVDVAGQLGVSVWCIDDE